MKGRLFWLVAAFLLGVAVHSAYLLAAPGLALSRSIAKTGLSLEDANFRLVSPQDQVSVFPTFPATSVFGVCAFDVSAGEAKINAVMPDSFWTLTIYSRTGKVIYALDREQAGTNAFTVSLFEAPSLLESLLTTTAEDLATQDGWTVTTSETKGFAVFWVPLRESAQRPGVEQVLKATSCRRQAAI